MDREVTVILCGILVLFLYIIVLGLIFTDLWAGVRKAKKRGEFRTSEGYKRTIDKISKYFNMMLALTFVDAGFITSIFFLHYSYGWDIPMFPLFTAIGAGYVGFVEVKSIREPADIKELKQQDDFKRMVVNIAKDHEHPEQVLTDVIEALPNAKSEIETKSENVKNDGLVQKQE